MEISGVSLIAGRAGAKTGPQFHAVNPATGQTVGPAFYSASEQDVASALDAAQTTFVSWKRSSGAERARLLRAIADGLDAATAELVAQARLETALPEARLKGETQRTSNQLRLFARVVEEGSWVEARIDPALPDRKPLPRPDLRSMLQPLGPVVVFGASNFPLAFSVAGGDTASALAAGCPVVVKAHPAHPGTSELAGQIIAAGLQSCGAPQGLFSLLFDSGFAVGQALVQHPLTQAVAFTGSRRGGRALMDLASNRPNPIPCFAEMGSTNPVFVLPGAMATQAKEIAAGLFGSFTLGAGQFCTKPGMVFLPVQEQTESLLAELRRLTQQSAEFTLLTPAIAANYRRGIEERSPSCSQGATATAHSSGACGATATLLETEIDDFLHTPELSQEIFGPTSLMIRCNGRQAMLRAAEELEGHLTATLLGTEEDLAAYQDLIAVLERKAGRVLFNGYPTGVEVCDAMVHGGPYPASSDSRFTSVGTRAILRFARPVCYQGFPQAALPKELRDENPRGILRMVDGISTRDPLGVARSAQ
ncbi:MAG: aldehyde dehydrogenase (NADP(+)) [Acidobacteriaceae bacterium]